MNMHKNAKLTPLGRERMVKMMLDGQTPAKAAVVAGVSPSRPRNGCCATRPKGGPGCKTVPQGQRGCASPPRPGPSSGLSPCGVSG